MWRSEEHCRNSAIAFQQWFLGRLTQCRSRSEIISLYEKSPVLRTRDSGLVPEEDWSVLTGVIQIRGWQHTRSAWWLELKHIRDRYSFPIPRTAGDPYDTYHGVGRHNCLDFSRLTAEGVREWSRWAIQHGIEYRGNNGYIFPTKSGKRRLEVARKQRFRDAKAQGVVPSGKRSPEAAIRRAAKRKASRLPESLRKVRSQMPVSPPAVLMSTPAKSSRWLSKDWRSKPEGPWSKYRENQVLKPVTVVWCQMGRTPVPKLVVDALRKIYSREEPWSKEDALAHLRARFNNQPKRQAKPVELWETPDKVPVSPGTVHPRAARKSFVLDGKLYEQLLGGQTTLVTQVTKQ
jgi:hypothetical protein